MATPKQQTRGDFKRVTPNVIHEAYIDQIVILGTQVTEYLGEKKYQEKVYMRWAIPGETIEIEGKEMPMVIGRTYTFSYFENAHLGKMLTGLLGRALTDQEQDTFDIFSILGKSCKILVTENTGRDGKTYSNITTVMPSQEVHTTGPLVKFDPDDPESSNVDLDDLRPWMVEKIENRQQGSEFISKQVASASNAKGYANSPPAAPTPPVEAYDDELDDRIPF